MNRIATVYSVAALAVLFYSVAIGCSNKVDGPTPSPKEVEPQVVCNEQLDTTIRLAGERVSPALVENLTDDPLLSLPLVTLIRSAELDGTESTESSSTTLNQVQQVPFSPALRARSVLRVNWLPTCLRPERLLFAITALLLASQIQKVFAQSPKVLLCRIHTRSARSAVNYLGYEGYASELNNVGQGLAHSSPFIPHSSFLIPISRQGAGVKVL